MKNNKIHIYTGNGKGKTTCALGLAVRALGADKKVEIIFFDKGGDEYAERKVLDYLIKEYAIKYYVFGRNRVIDKEGGFDFENREIDFKQIHKGIMKVKEVFKRNECNILILDEIITCILTKLIKEEDVLELIKLCPQNMELILTGRGATEKLIKISDLVSEVKEIKHYFQNNQIARWGIDY